MVYASINASVVDAKKVSMGVQLREKPVVKMTKERPPRNRESEPGRAKKAQKKRENFCYPTEMERLCGLLGYSEMLS